MRAIRTSRFDEGPPAVIGLRATDSVWAYMLYSADNVASRVVIDNPLCAADSLLPVLHATKYRTPAIIITESHCGLKVFAAMVPDSPSSKRFQVSEPNSALAFPSQVYRLTRAGIRFEPMAEGLKNDIVTVIPTYSQMDQFIIRNLMICRVKP